MAIGCVQDLYFSDDSFFKRLKGGKFEGWINCLDCWKKGGGQPEPLNSFVWLLRWSLKILRMRGEQTKTLSGSRNNHDQIGELVS